MLRNYFFIINLTFNSSNIEKFKAIQSRNCYLEAFYRIKNSWKIEIPLQIHFLSNYTFIPPETMLCCWLWQILSFILLKTIPYAQNLWDYYKKSFLVTFITGYSGYSGQRKIELNWVQEATRLFRKWFQEDINMFI